MTRVTEVEEQEGLSEEPVRPGSGGEGGDAGGGPSRLRKLSPLGRLGEFYQAVKLEMRKVTWPTRADVWSTTVVVLIAIVFFGFYLWGIDMVVTVGFEALEKAIR